MFLALLRSYSWHTDSVQIISRFFNSLPVSQGLLLVIKALPVAIIVLLLRWILHYGFDVNGLMSFSDATSVMTGATVIVGLMPVSYTHLTLPTIYSV